VSGEAILHDYWRSSAAYRVRIVLNLKGVAYRSVQVDLRAGDQATGAFHALNPQGLIPALEIDGHVAVVFRTPSVSKRSRLVKPTVTCG